MSHPELPPFVETDGEESYARTPAHDGDISPQAFSALTVAYSSFTPSPESVDGALYAACVMDWSGSAPVWHRGVAPSQQESPTATAAAVASLTEVAEVVPKNLPVLPKEAKDGVGASANATSAEPVVSRELFGHNPATWVVGETHGTVATFPPQRSPYVTHEASTNTSIETTGTRTTEALAAAPFPVAFYGPPSMATYRPPRSFPVTTAPPVVPACVNDRTTTASSGSGGAADDLYTMCNAGRRQYKLCRQWQQYRTCDKGSFCLFHHLMDDPVPPAPLPSQQSCAPYEKRGQCNRREVNKTEALQQQRPVAPAPPYPCFPSYLQRPPPPPPPPQPGTTRGGDALMRTNYEEPASSIRPAAAGEQRAPGSQGVQVPWPNQPPPLQPPSMKPERVYGPTGHRLGWCPSPSFLTPPAPSPLPVSTYYSPSQAAQLMGQAFPAHPTLLRPPANEPASSIAPLSLPVTMGCESGAYCRPSGVTCAEKHESYSLVQFLPQGERPATANVLACPLPQADPNESITASLTKNTPSHHSSRIIEVEAVVAAAPTAQPSEKVQQRSSGGAVVLTNATTPLESTTPSQPRPMSLPATPTGFNSASAAQTRRGAIYIHPATPAYHR